VFCPSHPFDKPISKKNKIIHKGASLQIEMATKNKEDNLSKIMKRVSSSMQQVLMNQCKSNIRQRN